MSTPWIREPPGPRESGVALVVAGVAAVGVGLMTFYVTRLLLSRERLGGKEVRGPILGGSGGGEVADGDGTGEGGA